MSEHEHQHDNFEEKVAAMDHMPKRFVMGARPLLYLTFCFLCFGLAAGEIGISSYFLQRYGNIFQHDYPTKMIKHNIGLTLFSGIYTLVVCLGAYAMPLYFFAFLLFSCWAFWLSNAIIYTVGTPFEAGSCGTSNPVWAPFVGQCSYYVGAEALAWTLFSLFTIWFILFVVEISVGKKQHRRRTVLGE